MSSLLDYKSLVPCERNHNFFCERSEDEMGYHVEMRHNWSPSQIISVVIDGIVVGAVVAVTVFAAPAEILAGALMLSATVSYIEVFSNPIGAGAFYEENNPVANPAAIAVWGIFSEIQDVYSNPEVEVLGPFPVPELLLPNPP